MLVTGASVYVFGTLMEILIQGLNRNDAVAIEGTLSIRPSKAFAATCLRLFTLPQWRPASADVRRLIGLGE